MVAYLSRARTDSKLLGDPLSDRLSAYACVMERWAGELNEAYHSNRGKKAHERFDGFYFDTADGTILASVFGGRIYIGGEEVSRDRCTGEYSAVQKDSIRYITRCAQWARFAYDEKMHELGHSRRGPQVPDTEGMPDRVFKVIETCKRAAEDEADAAGLLGLRN